MTTTAALVVTLVFSSGARAADPGDQAPYQSLTLLQEAVSAAGDFDGKQRLLLELRRARQDADAQPAERRGEVVERHMPAIDAAASGAGDGAVDDALAQLNNAAGRSEEAVGFASRQLSRDPDDVNALLSRANGLVGLQRLQEAYADADRAVKLAPDDPAALRARALVSYRLAHYPQALEDARRALALDPNDRAAFYVMQLASSKAPAAVKLPRLESRLAGAVQGEYHGMVQQINQVAESAAQPPKAPTAPTVESLLRSASTKISLKDYLGAIDDADRALTADPDNASAYYLRAAANNLLGRYAIAADDATRALVLDPTDVRAHDTRAWAFNSLGRFRDAIAESNHALELDPKNAYAYWNLGYAREQTGDLSGMMDALKTAADLSPQFQPAFHDAAQRHGLEADPTQERAAAAAQTQRQRSFAVVLVSSLIGGLLIALGFLHLFGEDAPEKKGPAKPPLPDLGGAYALGPEIGVGGMGLVYEAFDKALQRPVAVKVLRPEMLRDPGARERFLEEARTVAGLHHPAIVDIHAIVDTKAGLCLVFERIEGRTLEDILAKRGRLPLSEARALLRPVCHGLEFAHRHGVVHRDLKPGNVMVTSSGQIKLMDFGISRHDSRGCSALTPSQRATVRGTPHYMAPEQEYGEVRRESDLFSLGAMLYEMVTGRRPFEAPHTLDEKLARRYAKPSALVPGLPPALDGLVDWALQPDPHERVRTAADFLAALERVGDELPAVA